MSMASQSRIGSGANSATTNASIFEAAAGSLFANLLGRGGRAVFAAGL